MLRKTLIGGIGIGALMAGSALAADVAYVPPPQTFTPPPPPQTVQAHVDLYLGFASFSEEGDDSESALLGGGAGRANVPFSNNWNLQLDAQGRAFVFSEGKSSYSYPEFGGYAHLYNRDPGSHALGVFGGAYFLEGPQVYTAGVEGQLYWPQFTLYGQASFSAIEVYSDSATAVQVRGEGQWFLSDDTVILGDVIWTHLNSDGDDANVFTLAGTMMHRINSGPFSGFIRGQWDHYSFDGYSPEMFSAVVGVRVQADPPGSTLKSHLRTGPAMDVQPLPLFGGECFLGCG